MRSFISVFSLLACFLLLQSCDDKEQGRRSNPSNDVGNSSPITTNFLRIPTSDDNDNANRLLKKFHLKVDTIYDFSSFHSIKTKLKIMGGGDYEFIKFSVAHDSTRMNGLYEAELIARHLQTYWEMIYYKVINQTWIVEHSGSSDGSTSLIRIIKVAKGRNPNLNKE